MSERESPGFKVHYWKRRWALGGFKVDRKWEKV